MTCIIFILNNYFRLQDKLVDVDNQTFDKI